MEIALSIFTCVVCLFSGILLSRYWSLKTRLKDCSFGLKYYKYLLENICSELSKEGFPINNLLDELMQNFRKEIDSDGSNRKIN